MRNPHVLAIEHSVLELSAVLRREETHAGFPCFMAYRQDGIWLPTTRRCASMSARLLLPVPLGTVIDVQTSKSKDGKPPVCFQIATTVPSDATRIEFFPASPLTNEDQVMVWDGERRRFADPATEFTDAELLANWAFANVTPPSRMPRFVESNLSIYAAAVNLPLHDIVSSWHRYMTFATIVPYLHSQQRARIAKMLQAAFGVVPDSIVEQVVLMRVCLSHLRRAPLNVVVPDFAAKSAALRLIAQGLLVGDESVHTPTRLNEVALQRVA